MFTDPQTSWYTDQTSLHDLVTNAPMVEVTEEDCADCPRRRGEGGWSAAFFACALAIAASSCGPSVEHSVRQPALRAVEGERHLMGTRFAIRVVSRDGNRGWIRRDAAFDLRR